MSGPLEEQIMDAKPTMNDLSKQRIKERIMTAYDTHHESPARRRWISVAAAAVMLAIGLVITGPALAQWLLPFVFTDGPTAAEQAADEPYSPEGAITLESISFTDTNEATTQAGFAVVVPRQIPSGYSVTDGIELVKRTDGTVGSVSLMATNETQQIFYYSQVPFEPSSELDPFELPIGDADPQPVTIGAAEGVWLHRVAWGTIHNPDTDDILPVDYNLLLWVDAIDGQSFIFWLGMEENVSLDTMLAIAKSVE